MVSDPAATRRVESTGIVEWQDGRRRRLQDELAREEPLEIRVKGIPVSVTMRTPGDDEELAIGFLATEGLITARDDVRSIDTMAGAIDDTDASGDANFSAAGDAAVDAAVAVDAGHDRLDTNACQARPDERRGNVVDVALRSGLDIDLERLRRNVFAASSCGVCGKASIDLIRIRGVQPPARDLRLDPVVLCGMPDTLRAAQTVFGQTGGLHAAGLFDTAGRLLAIREDVGRHNAVDKIIGHALLTTGLPLSSHVLVVSGRGGFEIIQKALVAGVPILASVSAPSSLAVQLARDLQQTLIGFLRGSRFVVYSGEERLL